MAEAIITTPKRGNIKSQVTKTSKDVSRISLEVAKLKGHLDVIIKAPAKLESLKEDYFKLATSDDFLQTEAALCQLDDDIQE